MDHFKQPGNIGGIVKNLIFVLVLLFPKVTFAARGSTFYDSGGVKYIQIMAPTIVPASYTIIFPDTPGSINECLQISSIVGQTLTMAWGNCGGIAPVNNSLLLGDGQFLLLGNGSKLLLGQ